jgi:hypothetical protein
MALSGTERELIGTRWMIRTENAVTRATAEGVIGVASQRARAASPPTGSRAPVDACGVFLALERGVVGPEVPTGLACRRAVPPLVGVPHLGGLVPPLEIGVEGVVDEPALRPAVASSEERQRLRTEASAEVLFDTCGRSLDRPVLLSSRGGGRRSKPKRPAIGGRR